jgi:hypothetical protein
MWRPPALVTVGWGAAAQDLSVRLVAEEEWSQEGQELVSSMRTSPQAGQAPALDGAAAGGQEEGGGGAGEGDWVRYDIPCRRAMLLEHERSCSGTRCSRVCALLHRCAPAPRDRPPDSLLPCQGNFSPAAGSSVSDSSDSTYSDKEF